MGDISSNFNVRKEIGYSEFLAELKNQKTNIKNEQEARSIFQKYAGDDGVLSEDEQIEARKEYLQIDTDDNEKLSKKEFKKGKSGNTGNNYDAYRIFNQTLDNITADAERTVVERDDDEIVTVEGQKTPEVVDDKVDGKPTVPAEPTPPVVKEPAFASKDAATLAVYQYLLGQDITGDDIKRLDDSNGNKFKEQITIGDVTEGGADEVEVIYNGKTYILKKSGDSYSINEKQEDGEEGTPQTLQQAIFNDTESVDIRHAYRNRYGSAGNNQSTYDRESGEIKNTSNKRRHVNPAQTFAKMLMNSAENSTLTVDKGLSGQDVINVIKGDDADGITLNDLMKYLSATLLEEHDTKEAGLATGVRAPAGDADMDLKDIANIGVIFRKYDADNDRKLNAEELTSLINDLKNNSMSQLVRGAKDYYNQATSPDAVEDTPPTDTPPAKLEDKPFSERTGKEASANRTRKLADNGDPINYRYENGTRTVIKGGQVVENANVAKYQDHGLFGWGKKDFIYIEGLEAGVSAEVVDPKKHDVKGNQTIKIKKRGNQKVSEYYEVTYQNGTYRLGANKIMVHLFGDDDKNKYTEIPNGLKLEYKKGKPVYKMNGHEISEERARALVIAANGNTKAQAAAAPQGPPATTPPVKRTPAPDRSKKDDPVVKENEGKDYANYTASQWKDEAKKAADSKDPAKIEAFVALYHQYNPDMTEQQIGMLFNFPERPRQ